MKLKCLNFDECRNAFQEENGIWIDDTDGYLCQACGEDESIIESLTQYGYEYSDDVVEGGFSYNEDLWDVR